MNDKFAINDDSEDFTNLPSFLSGVKKDGLFPVPEAYFDGLADRVMDRIEAIELAETTPVFSRIPKPSDPPVSESYFSELASRIESGILLDSISEQISIPASYFEELPAEVENAVRLDKLAISRAEPFEVEPDYFDWLPSRITDRILEENKPRLSLSRIRQWLLPRYLIPAGLSFTLLLVIAIRSFYISPVPTADTASLNLTDKDKNEVIESFELLGFEESLVNEHLATASNATAHPPAASADAVEYLIDNNMDLNTPTLEN